MSLDPESPMSGRAPAAGPEVAVNASPPSTTADARWVDWVDGWYWRTDAVHRLELLKPPSGADPSVWASCARWHQWPGPWWTCVPQDGTPDLSLPMRTELEIRLRAGGHLDLIGDWGPLGAAPGDGPWQILGSDRRDATGRIVGHHGIWRRRPTPVARVPAAPMPSRMSEGEQEALRYALSHDLRAPLRSVEGFARIVKEDYGHLLDRVGNDHLERVMAAATRMNGMIDAILAQAQLSRASLATRTVDVTALARDVAADLDAFDPGAAGHRPKVRWMITEGLLVQADPDLLRRVLENLLGNALKYSSKVDSPVVEVGVVPATDPLVFFVRDNGAGFDMQHADKLFGLFQRLHSTGEFPGTGVGLAGVQQIIHRHGGKVWAEAAPSKGACFYFTLTGSAR